MKPIDGRQLRAARAILGWSSAYAAKAAGIHRNSVSRIEAFETLPIHARAADRLGEAFERVGVQFTMGDNGPAVAFQGPRYRMRRQFLK